jgi:hypothetical protein
LALQAKSHCHGDCLETPKNARFAWIVTLSRKLACVAPLVCALPKPPMPTDGARKLARQPVGLSAPKTPNRANGRALARARAAVRVCPRVRVGGVGAGARVTVTGTVRKQFFIFWSSANNF